jgi:hypothetical protein
LAVHARVISCAEHKVCHGFAQPHWVLSCHTFSQPWLHQWMVVDKLCEGFVTEGVAMAGAVSISRQPWADHVMQVSAVSCGNKHSCQIAGCQDTDKRYHCVIVKAVPWGFYGVHPNTTFTTLLQCSALCKTKSTHPAGSSAVLCVHREKGQQLPSSSETASCVDNTGQKTMHWPR